MHWHEGSIGGQLQLKLNMHAITEHLGVKERYGRRGGISNGRKRSRGGGLEQL
jgi:hypothetical protein